jgi:hypothetical protein
VLMAWLVPVCLVEVVRFGKYHWRGLKVFDVCLALFEGGVSNGEGYI